MDAAQQWAHETFGDTDLGDKRRSKRLVKMLSSMMTHNNEYISKSFASPEEIKGAYRWINNENIDKESILKQSCQSCLISDEKYLVVVIDGSSISIENRRAQSLGHIGTSKSKTKGYQVITSLAYTPQGRPLGVMDQHYWKRTKKIQSKKAYDRQKSRRRKFEEKENYFIIKTAASCQSQRDQVNPAQKLWFQHDRGADAHEMLKHVTRSQDYWTIRASQDRKIKNNTILRSFAALSVQSPTMTGLLYLPRCGKSCARTVPIEIRAASLTLEVKKCNDEKNECIDLHFIEVKGFHEGQKICWRLITNYPVQSHDDILLVIDHYKLRWSVEEFHRTWKETCRIEETKLRKEKAIQLWCSLNAVIAMRIEEIKKVSRQTPDEDATVIFSKEEIQAIILIRKPKNVQNQPITLQQAVYWLAELGGYQGLTASGGPPGSVVIGRGLERIATTAQLLKHYDLVPKSCG